MNSLKDRDIGVYAVWLPMLGFDSRASVSYATKRFSDSRVQQYWDANAELAKSYSPILKADGNAWDVYMLFDQKAEWNDKPPAPVYVMDKIGLPSGRRLDGTELAKQIIELQK